MKEEPIDAERIGSSRVYFLNVPHVRPNSWTEPIILGLKFLWLWWWLRKRKKEFDFVLTTNTDESLINYAAMKLTGASAKLIIYHQIHPLESMRHVDPFRKMLGHLFLRLNRRVSAILCVSSGLVNTLASLVGNRVPIFLLLGSIDLEFVSRQSREPVKALLDAPDTGKIITYVGRLSNAQKRIDLLLHAAAMLVRLKPELRFTLGIVGDGEDRESLEALARELNLSKQVKFLGFHENPYPFMARSSCFVLPSDFEGFGLVLVEAMSLGVPVIATDCPSGPLEILEGGNSGMLVPMGDREQLASRISDLLENSDLAAALSKKGIERAKYFDCKKVFSNFGSGWAYFSS